MCVCVCVRALRRRQAYATMKKLKKNQCIVVSGESGAGKTETNRQLLNYLVWRGTDANSQDTLTQKILDTNPILESLGNAAMAANPNSSRFGKFVSLLFAPAACPVGSVVCPPLPGREPRALGRRSEARVARPKARSGSQRLAAASQPLAAARSGFAACG